MKGGRELDALIAEKVMGRDMTRPEGFKYPIGMPRYSRDIAAAWAVVETMVALGCGYEVAFGGSHGHEHMVSFEHPTKIERSGSPGAQRWADSAPLAICLAALAAVGAEVPA